MSVWPKYERLDNLIKKVNAEKQKYLDGKVHAEEKIENEKFRQLIKSITFTQAKRSNKAQNKMEYMARKKRMTMMVKGERRNSEEPKPPRRGESLEESVPLRRGYMPPRYNRVPVNPITGILGQNPSSRSMAETWERSQNLMEITKRNQQELQKIKERWSTPENPKEAPSRGEEAQHDSNQGRLNTQKMENGIQSAQIL